MILQNRMKQTKGTLGHDRALTGIAERYNVRLLSRRGKDVSLTKKKGPLGPLFKLWLRGRDLNPGPQGYEPCELPDCSTPRQVFGQLFLHGALNRVKVGRNHGRKKADTVVDCGYHY